MFLKVLVGHGKNGMFKAWKKDERHRRECKMLRIFDDVWPENSRPFPWRISKVNIDMLDQRALRICWPHYMEPICYDGASFWKQPQRLWKCRRKIRLLYVVLPTQLRDQVPQVRNAISQFVWAMRRLMGQVDHTRTHTNSHPTNLHITTTTTYRYTATQRRVN